MKELPRVARYTSHLHVQAAVLEGLLAGVLVTRDVVARKSFDASQFALVVITMAPSLCSALAIFIAPHVERFDRRKLFIYAGVFGRLSLLGVGLVIAPHMLPLFVSLNVMHELAQVVVIPAQNTVYQANYLKSHRSRLFGRASTFQGLTTAVTALVAGMLLDRFPEAHRFLYPIAGCAGLASCLIFARIRVRRLTATVPLYQTVVPDFEAPAPPSALGAILGTLRETLIENRNFRNFEIGFFLYGLGFMMLQPVFAPFFVDVLGLDYEQASLAKAVVFHLFFIASLPLAARMADRFGIPWIAVSAYALLFCFAGALVFVEDFPGLLAAFALFGVAMSGVSIAWNLGPTHFARETSSARTMSIHYSLVGVRAAIGFPVGGMLAAWYGPRTVFASSTVMFLAAILVMSRVARAEHALERAAAAPPGSRPPA